MYDIFYASLLLLVLLNPFLVIVYLIDVLKTLSVAEFRKVLIQAGFISFLVFTVFTIVGDAFFRNFIQAEFASFQIFGGIVFLLIGMQFIFQGGVAIKNLRGGSKQLASTIAMPVLIGPGTISYSIVIGERLKPLPATVAIFIAVVFSIGILILLKFIHDKIQQKNEVIIERYFDIAGRITALIVGTISVEMIMTGIKSWIEKIAG